MEPLSFGLIVLSAGQVRRVIRHTFKQNKSCSLENSVSLAVKRWTASGPPTPCCRIKHIYMYVCESIHFDVQIRRFYVYRVRLLSANSGDPTTDFISMTHGSQILHPPRHMAVTQILSRATSTSSTPRPFSATLTTCQRVSYVGKGGCWHGTWWLPLKAALPSPLQVAVFRDNIVAVLPRAVTHYASFIIPGLQARNGMVLLILSESKQAS